MNPARAIYLVARRGEDIVASIRACAVTAWDGAQVCEYGPVAVLPSCQGLGLGTLILKACEVQVAWRFKTAFIQLAVANWRAQTLVPFYSKHGFAVVGEQPFASKRHRSE